MEAYTGILNTLVGSLLGFLFAIAIFRTYNQMLETIHEKAEAYINNA